MWEVQLDVLFKFPEGEPSAIPSPGDVDEPDAEHSVVSSMLPIEDIQTLNLLPDLQTDAFNYFYTVLPGETPDHSGAV